MTFIYFITLKTLISSQQHQNRQLKIPMEVCKIIIKLKININKFNKRQL